MIGYYNVSVILTYLSLVSAMCGMPLALSGHVQWAVICLIFCGLCDCFDGAIARMCKRTDSEKRFGVEIDSLCDLVSFSVFPAIIGYSVGMNQWYWYPVLAFFVLAGVIRLGYFNVQEIERAQAGGGHRTHFEGLPVTSSALLAPVLLLAAGGLKCSMVYAFGLLGIGVLNILRFKLEKPYGKKLLIMSAIGAVVLVLVCMFGETMNALHG